MSQLESAHTQGIATSRKSREIPGKYEVARKLALAGELDAADCEYNKLLAEFDATEVQALIYNDLAAIAAVCGRPDEARGLLQRSLSLDSRPSPALHNARLLGIESLASTPLHKERLPKIAIVSVHFNWPSRGGGNVHTVELALGLMRAGYDVRHIYIRYPAWRIGEVSGLPVASQEVEVGDAQWSLGTLQERIREAVDDFAPNHVLITDCWSLKPWIAAALDGFSRILRFDAQECLCPLNNLRIIPLPDRRLQPCPNHWFVNRQQCVACVREREAVISPRHGHERSLSRFDSPEYHGLLVQMLHEAAAVLVHNPHIAAELEPYSRHVMVVPIGVDASRFSPPFPATCGARRVVRPVRLLFAGRTTDPVKGFAVLQEAATRLWRERQDFCVVATGDGEAEPFVNWLGWRSHDDMPPVLADADVLVAPSVAEEPFGISVVEAMAMGLPVVATRVGGQQFTVIDEQTGLLCPPGDAEGLARQLRRLLDSPDLRRSFGEAGREHFLAEYSWDVVIDRYYRPLLGFGQPVKASG